MGRTGASLGELATGATTQSTIPGIIAAVYRRDHQRTARREVAL